MCNGIFFILNQYYSEFKIWTSVVCCASVKWPPWFHPEQRGHFAGVAVVGFVPLGHLSGLEVNSATFRGHTTLPPHDKGDWHLGVACHQPLRTDGLAAVTRRPRPLP